MMDEEVTKDATYCLKFRLKVAKEYIKILHVRLAELEAKLKVAGRPIELDPDVCCEKLEE